MTYVITTACSDVKDGARMKACPVDAIYEDHHIPERFREFVTVNAEFLGPAVTGWGDPGGAMAKGPSALDHPAVAAHPIQKKG